MYYYTCPNCGSCNKYQWYYYSFCTQNTSWSIWQKFVPQLSGDKTGHHYEINYFKGRFNQIRQFFQETSSAKVSSCKIFQKSSSANILKKIHFCSYSLQLLFSRINECLEYIPIHTP